MWAPLERSAPSAPLLADGALGTLLQARGVGGAGSPEACNLSHPDAVTELHRDYIEAGADIVFTNTFGANRFKLRALGLADKLAEINAAGVRLARQAAARAARRIGVAGDVGPLGVRLAPFGPVRPAQARRAFAAQIEILLEAGIDLLVLETISDLREMLEALRAAKKTTSVPVIATMSFTRDDRALLGESPTAIATALLAAGADAVGVNCSGGPAQAMRILGAMRQQHPEARLAVKPNAGWPEQVGERIVYPAGPEYFAHYAVAFAAAGASIIGGCCGTTPAHVAAMRRALDHRPPSASTAITIGAAVSEAQPPPTPAPAPGRLARLLAEKRFVISVEMNPPRGLSTDKPLAGARRLAAAGADLINVADSPLARMRMSAWALCHLIERDVGIETVLHFPTRGRNLLRVQGDLLAAHALGIRNVFVVLGDPTAIGDHPTAMNTYDLVPSGLIELIKRGFNAGLDHAGGAIGRPTSFLVGCALNLGAPDIDKEIRSLRRKMAAGADFALTQPVYESAALDAFRQRYRQRHGELALPLLVGVLPLFNSRHASFLHNEVPGIQIPATLRHRLAIAGDDSAGEGIRIAGELVADLRPLAQGVYLMPPFGRYEMAEAIIAGLRAPPAR